MARSVVTVDLAAIRHNAARLLSLLGGAELWAVVKADAYGHGAVDVAPAVLEGGATALCVATVGEGLEVRAVAPGARIVVLGPTWPAELPAARAAKLELVVATDAPLPAGIRLHLKLDTGMARWGLSELPRAGVDVVGVMTHFATSDTDPGFVREQLRRFREATGEHAHLARHAANSAAALALPETRLDAARCGITLYGVDPFGEDAGRHGLRPALRWESEVARVALLAPGESTGYGRRFVAEEPTWIGQVPVGYADGFSRDLTGAHVLVEGARCEVVGTISMDSFAVRLPAPVAPGTTAVLVGDGVTLEQHARVAGTIPYELACGIRTPPTRSARMVGR